MTITKWDYLFMKVADLYAQYSTCAKIKVGAVLQKDRRIISSGYNGVPQDHQHCKDIYYSIWQRDYSSQMSFNEYTKSKDFLDSHAIFSDKYELHAELNCILFAREKNLNNCILYVTYSPCTYCSKLIITSNIKKVFYRYVYKKEHLITLKKSNIETIQLTY
jgi:dCMP deaminase